MRKYAIKLIISSETVMEGLLSNPRIVYPYPPVEITSGQQFKQIETEFLEKHPTGLMLLCDEQTVKMNKFDEIIDYEVPTGSQLLCDVSSDLSIITENK